MYVRKLALDYRSKLNNQPILFDNIREFWRDDHFDQDLEITTNFFGLTEIILLWNCIIEYDS